MKKKSPTAPIERTVFGYSDLQQTDPKHTDKGFINPNFNPGALKRIKSKQANMPRVYTVVKPLHYIENGNKLSVSPGETIIFNQKYIF